MRNRIIWLALGLGVVGCSNQKNTFMSRQYHALTTHYNVYFNGKESLKEGQKKMEGAHEENFTDLLPVFVYQDEAARSMANGNMDQTIEKASKAIKLHSITRKPKRKKGSQSEKSKEFRKKKEFNEWIDDCYLLMGKAQFYKKEYKDANKTYRFILREYPESELRFETQLWQIRCLVDQGEYTGASERLYRLEAEAELPKYLRKEIHCLRADLNIRRKNYEDAIPDVESAISLENRKYNKARYQYLLAQLYQKVGQDGAASQAYRKLIKMNPSYAMTFNAKISRALSYNGAGNGEEIRKELRKMLRDRKNSEFKDQIYYALAEMDMTDEQTSEAISNYWESAKVSVANDNQKALSFLKLGDYYFENLNYKKAQLCYDSSVVYLNQEYPNYEVISSRVKNLTELVNNLNTVEREDSLQMVARMDSRERDALIAGIIKGITDREQEKRQEEMENMQDRMFFNQNNMMGRQGGSTVAQGGWYFYNPTTVGLGKADFQRKWGKRKLTDNWRRKNKSVVEISDEPEEDTGEEKKEEVVAISKDPKSRDFYLVDLPLTDSLVKLSDESIMKGLYQAALVYEEKLKDSKEALKTQEELIRRFPETSYLLSAYYHCYALNREMGNVTRAEYYKGRIVKEFEGSDYARALSDPEYYNKLEAESQKVNLLYEKAFEDYNNFYFYRVVKACNEGLLRFPESDLRPKFLFLRAMGIGRTEGSDNFKRALRNVLEVQPEQEIKAMVESILKAMEQGAVPVMYSAADMEMARQNRLLRNWRFEESAPIVQQNASSKDMSVSSGGLYNFDPKAEHYFVLLFPKEDADPNRVLFNINKYNVGKYNDRTFDVDRISLDEKNVMVIVKGLKNKEIALNYFNDIVTNETAYKGLEDADYRNFVISVPNFEIFTHNQDVDQYLNFYTQKYFGKERKSETSIVKQDGKLATIQEVEDADTAFIDSPEENHKFVLIVPSRKVNANKLRADVYSHDKDYQVVKEAYDADYTMILVNNIGNKREAMGYFRKIVENRAIFQPLETVDYRNFIISSSNFENFFVNKRLYQYMDFFRKTYLSDEVGARKKDQSDQAIQDGMYAYQANTPHYFALVYPTSGVNSKKLEAGIRKYNSEGFSVEVKPLDENREILLVNNMQNKKQAMIYFRAIVTNRNLFAPIDKVDYRNFVISQKNLEIFLKDTDTALYMDFFKKWYLQ